MKALYFDCSMGAAGDMLTAALLELYPEKEKFLAEMNRVFDGKAVVSAAPDTKCGVTGTHVTMTVDGDEESEGAQYHDLGTGQIDMPGHDAVQAEQQQGGEVFDIG